MARLFPLKSDTKTTEGQPRVVDLEGEDADAVFSALSSSTAREIYSRLSDEPGTPSDVAEAIDSSIQNVRYHLEKLEDAGLVEVVDTWYSSRGNEMSVYSTTDGPLIVTSDQSRASRLKEALSRFLGGVAALAGGSFFVQYAAERYFDPADDVEYVTTDDGDAGAGGGATDDADETEGDDTTEDGTGDGDEPTEGEDGPDIQEAPAEEEDAEEDADADFDEADDVGGDGADDAGGDGDVTGDDIGITGDEVNVTGDEVGIVDSPEVLDAATTLPPGLLFFLGGLLVLAVVTAYWYWSTRRLA